jgi:rhombotail lipoprotein
VKRQSTFVNASEQLGADSADGFDGAARQMIDNLERELEAFRRRVDEHPDRYRIVRTPEFERRLGGTADTRVGAP